jgi:pyridoxal phosphate enzyme (YggS family)
MNNSIKDNIAILNEKIGHLEQKYEREAGSVQLMAVTKTRTGSDIRQAFEAGVHDFGENYVQEALDKQVDLTELPLKWHFIGPIQSNKTRQIAENFDWVHSIDSLKVAQRLSRQRPETLAPLKVLIQVNISHESSKSGVELSDLNSLAKEVASLPHLELCGLMTIPAATAEFDRQRQAFRQLRLARDALVENGLSTCRLLSMGMSNDMEAAIAEGADWIRIGTALFGPRPVRPQ